MHKTNVTVTIPVVIHHAFGKREKNISVDVPVEEGWDEQSREQEFDMAVEKLARVLEKLCEV